MDKVRGFTIVELLIVIVVIAVLASVTAFSVSGMKTRAENTARVASARHLINLTKTYISTNGVSAFKTILPPGQGGCMGEGWEDVDPNEPWLDCFYAVENYDYENYYWVGPAPATYNNAMKALGTYRTSYPTIRYPDNSKPNLTDFKISAPTIYYQDVLNTYVNGMLDKYGYIEYTLEGFDKDCASKPQLRYIGIVNGSASYQTNDSWKNSSTQTYATGFSDTVCKTYFHPDKM